MVKSLVVISSTSLQSNSNYRIDIKLKHVRKFNRGVHVDFFDFIIFVCMLMYTCPPNIPHHDFIDFSPPPSFTIIIHQFLIINLYYYNIYNLNII